MLVDTYTHCSEAVVALTNTGSYRAPNQVIKACAQCCSTKILHHMFNSHQPQQDSQQRLPCWTGKGLLIFNHRHIASPLSLTSKKLLTPLVSRKPKEEHLRKISNLWNTRACKRCILNPLSVLHESKDLSRLAWLRASPRKWVFKA